jgi:hypothetical protein
MIRMTFECPGTGEPLQSMALDDWTAVQPDLQMALHCPKCSQLHTFTSADAIVEVRARFGRRPELSVVG